MEPILSCQSLQTTHLLVILTHIVIISVLFIYLLLFYRSYFVFLIFCVFVLMFHSLFYAFLLLLLLYASCCTAILARTVDIISVSNLLYRALRSMRSPRGENVSLRVKSPLLTLKAGVRPKENE